MKKWNASSGALLITLWISIGAWAQQDPGPRPGPAGAGGPYPTLNASQQAFFSQAFLRFQEVTSVSGTIEKGSGLGPTFNGNSCAMCHAQPFSGGSSPGLASPQNPIPNPQVALATLDGATNSVPGFILSLIHISIDEFIEQVFNYPTLSETYKYAAYEGLGNLAGHKIREG